VHRLLRSERLVTIVGPGGVGKTRLALELAQQVDNATVLPLASVTDPRAIPHALAAALGLHELRGDVLTGCIAVLGNAPALLVVDNCEHLIAAVTEMISAVLGGCPNLTVLATSREPLGLAAECSSRLTPLPLPTLEPRDDQDVGRLEHVPSVALFLERASRVLPGFRTGPAELRRIGDIVRRLDGIPLAIELAAGRLSSFSLADLTGRLDRALDLLGSGRAGQEDRHRTLRSTIGWSYQLLTSDEQRLFRHLAVFPDGVDLDTAEVVAAGLELPVDPGSALAHLVEASMINATFGDRTRYRMLETLRQFGLDRLTAEGEATAAEQHLVRWAVRLTAWVDDMQVTEREPDADAVLRREVPNLRAAWGLVRRARLLDGAVALAQSVSSVSAWRDLTETLHWAEELATDPALNDHPHAPAVLGSAANSAYMRGDYGRADQLARAGLKQGNDPKGSWRCLSALALADLSRGAYADVLTHSLAAASLAPLPSEALSVAALAATYAGDLDQARQLNHQMMSAAASPTLRAFSAYVYGEIDNAAGHLDPAQQHYATAIDLARSSGATFVVGIASVGLLTVLDAAGRTKDALRGYRKTIDYWDRSGNWTQQWVTLRNLASLLRRVDAAEPAALIDAAADQAPDAPATNGSKEPIGSSAASTPKLNGSPDRAYVLEVARQAISQSLARL
jgi:predicted ATPase